MSQNQKTQTGQPMIAVENNAQTSDDASQYHQMMETPSDLQEQILIEAEAQGIPSDIIDLPAMMTPRRDSEGHLYVTDCNNVIRYYLPSAGEYAGKLVPTDEFVEMAKVVDSNERTNTFEDIYNI